MRKRVYPIERDQIVETVVYVRQGHVTPVMNRQVVDAISVDDDCAELELRQDLLGGIRGQLGVAGQPVGHQQLQNNNGVKNLRRVLDAEYILGQEVLPLGRKMVQMPEQIFLRQFQSAPPRGGRARQTSLRHTGTATL